FDEALQGGRLKLVRFADDFVVMGKSRTQAERAQVKVADLLNNMGLRLHPDKTKVTSFAQGFRFLGHAFVGDLVVPVKRQKVPPRQRLKESELKIVHADAPAIATQM
ncbi:MAG: reverse transcriptase domain-containing protein, partial [Cyanobacteria bacterium J06643_4]